MSDVIKETLNNIEIFEAETYENMTVIGLNIPDNNIDLMSLEKGMDLGLVEITELNGGASVGEVKVINNAVTPLLIIDGEEIIGSKQNRIVNATIIIPPQSERIIPVSCVEEGRWNYNSKRFKYSKHMATGNLRRNKLESVSNQLRQTSSYESNQQKVWDNVSETLDSLEVTSNTRALHDTYIQKDSLINDYNNAFSQHDKQNGMIVYINGQLAGFEIIYNSARYGEYHKKMIESYVLDAIAKRDETCQKEKMGVNEFIDKIISSPRESFNSVGLGEDYRLDDDEISGSVLVLDDNLINASFFIKEEVNSDI